MTALVLDNLAALPFLTHRLRVLLARSVRALDALVSARAARAVTESELCRADSEIDKFRRLMSAGHESRTDAARTRR